jgi:lipopolysaccharide/colanic/teichoic acid biosynthesis glycosyltransferase
LDAVEGARGRGVTKKKWSRRPRRKAAFDVIAGSVLALVALPVIAVCAIGAAIALRSWPFFVQRRVGFREREFRFVKIRSLPRCTPVATDKYSLDAVPIPRFARFLRASHLDELPQLLLVPLRKMSLVGPRPEMPEIATRYPAEFASVRTSMLPGCTGLWQVSEDASGMIYEAPEYDEFYIRNWSMRLDFWILWRTLRGLLEGQFITLEDLPVRVGTVSAAPTEWEEEQVSSGERVPVSDGA